MRGAGACVLVAVAVLCRARARARACAWFVASAVRALASARFAERPNFHACDHRRPPRRGIRQARRGGACGLKWEALRGRGRRDGSHVRFRFDCANARQGGARPRRPARPRSYCAFVEDGPSGPGLEMHWGVRVSNSSYHLTSPHLSHSDSPGPVTRRLARPGTTSCPCPGERISSSRPPRPRMS